MNEELQSVNGELQLKLNDLAVAMPTEKQITTARQVEAGLRSG